MLRLNRANHDLFIQIYFPLLDFFVNRWISFFLPFIDRQLRQHTCYIHFVVMLSSAPTTYTTFMYETHQSNSAFTLKINIYTFIIEKYGFDLLPSLNLGRLECLKSRGPAGGKMSGDGGGHKCSATCVSPRASSWPSGAPGPHVRTLPPELRSGGGPSVQHRQVVGSSVHP